MVGVTSRFAFNKCRVYDPLVMAFYVDPTRRFVNPDTQILERQAYTVRDTLIEPYGDAALLASIPADYCDQYGETYKSDGREHGIDMYKCGDHAVVWSTSWLLGESLPRLAVISYDKVTAAKGGDLDGEQARLPPSYPHLVSRENWLANVAPGKHRLPFPLRLSDLGIRSGTATQWLVWTDEFAHLTDGRNDAYGGRLVERERPITHAVDALRDRTAAAAMAAVLRSDTAGGRFEFTGTLPTNTDSIDNTNNLDSGGGIVSKRNRREADTESDRYLRYQSVMLKSLELGTGAFHKVLDESIEQERENGSRAIFDLTGGFTYGVAYSVLSKKLEWPTLTSVLKCSFNALRRAPSYVKKASVKSIGYLASESACAHVLEKVATRGLVTRLKTLAMAQALGPLALIVDVIALIGMAVDITFVLLNAFGVSTPISRREHFVSDRRLYRLAQAELELNRRLYGVGNVELTPYQFVVNTPYLTADDDMESHLVLTSIMYVARQMNSDGGLLRPDAASATATADGTVWNDEFRVDENGKIHHYTANDERLATIHDEEHTSSAADHILQPRLARSTYVASKRDGNASSSVPGNTVTDKEANYRYYLFAVLFIAVFLGVYFYPNKYWTIAVALLASVLTVLKPAWTTVSKQKRDNASRR